MGVTGLWDILNDVKEDVDLTTLNGKTLAVDLSAWIVQCGTVFTNSTLVPSDLRRRNIFFRCLNLISMGISLVFTMDGLNAPEIKRRKRGQEYYHLGLEYKELLMSMGFPVIQADGEAEKLCAELNKRKIVDGVLTEDGDVLIYGAENVYKGLMKENKVHTASHYSMSLITKELGLTKRDLVAFALLSKGDICDGVPGVGEKKFLELFKELQKNEAGDVLDRLLSWRTNDHLCCVDELQQSLGDTHKSKHCSKCCHEGTKQKHTKDGCITCQLSEGCSDKKEWTTEEPYPQCPCVYHEKESRLQPYHTELKVRKAALAPDVDFPAHKVVEEYLNPIENFPTELCCEIRLPDFPTVCSKMSKHFPPGKTISHMLPAYTKLGLHGQLSAFNLSPLSIKPCVENKEHCYLVTWDKSAIDLPDDGSTTYECKVLSKLFEQKYPKMVEQLQNDIKKQKEAKKHSLSGKKKRSNEKIRPDKSSNAKITDFFQVKKQKTIPQTSTQKC